MSREDNLGFYVLVISLTLNLIFLLWIFLGSDFHFVDPLSFAQIKSLEDVDVLNAAVQIGRLDLVSMLLAIFGLLIAIATVFGFIEVRKQAAEKAENVAKEVANRVVGKQLEAKLTTMVTRILREQSKASDALGISQAEDEIAHIVDAIGAKNE